MYKVRLGRLRGQSTNCSIRISPNRLSKPTCSTQMPLNLLHNTSALIAKCSYHILLTMCMYVGPGVPIWALDVSQAAGNYTNGRQPLNYFVPVPLLQSSRLRLFILPLIFVCIRKPAAIIL